MKRSLTTLLLSGIIAVLTVLPASAQQMIEFTEPACVYTELPLDASGLYLYLFITVEDIEDLITISVEDVIRYGEPYSVLESFTIISPNTILLLFTSNGDAVAFTAVEDMLVYLSQGGAKLRFARMDVDCMRAAADGRLNRFEQQMLAAIYPDGQGGYRVLKVDAATSEGDFDYGVTRAQVDEALANADSSGQPQGIASGATSTLYALGNGECQLNSPNAQGTMQEFVFGCRS